MVLFFFGRFFCDIRETFRLKDVGTVLWQVNKNRDVSIWLCLSVLDDFQKFVEVNEKWNFSKS